MATSGNLLSAEELAALSEGIDDGTIAIDTGFNLTTRVKKHDLASEDSTLGVNTSSLEMINERFVRLFRMGLMDVLRTSPRINPTRAQIVRFGDYLKDMRPPLAVNTVRINPLRGFSLVMIEPTLVFSSLDNFLVVPAVVCPPIKSVARETKLVKALPMDWHQHGCLPRPSRASSRLF